DHAGPRPGTALEVVADRHRAQVLVAENAAAANAGAADERAAEDDGGDGVLAPDCAREDPSAADHVMADLHRSQAAGHGNLTLVEGTVAVDERVVAAAADERAADPEADQVIAGVDHAGRVAGAAEDIVANLHRADDVVEAGEGAAEPSGAAHEG